MIGAEMWDLASRARSCISALVIEQFAPTARAPASSNSRSDPTSGSPMTVWKPLFFRSKVSDTKIGRAGAARRRDSRAINASRRSLIVSMWRASTPVPASARPWRSKASRQFPGSPLPDGWKILAGRADVSDHERGARRARDADCRGVQFLATIRHAVAGETDGIRAEGVRVNGIASRFDVGAVYGRQLFGALLRPCIGRHANGQAARDQHRPEPAVQQESGAAFQTVEQTLHDGDSSTIPGPGRATVPQRKAFTTRSRARPGRHAGHSPRARRRSPPPRRRSWERRRPERAGRCGRPAAATARTRSRWTVIVVVSSADAATMSARTSRALERNASTGTSLPRSWTSEPARGQERRHQALSDVVQIALHGSDHDRSGTRAPAPAGIQRGLEDRHGGLHGFGALDQFGKEVLALLPKLSDSADPCGESFVDRENEIGAIADRILGEPPGSGDVTLHDSADHLGMGGILHPSSSGRGLRPHPEHYTPGRSGPSR